jgi:hypothetical protein
MFKGKYPEIWLFVNIPDKPNSASF